MNIFYLAEDPTKCAELHVDKHVVKMILETAQLLSTAHRVIDGTEIIRISEAGRKLKYWKLPDDREEILYKATHVNHPSAVWTRKTKDNYKWLCELFKALLSEYTYRYGKYHKSGELIDYLYHFPDKITKGIFTPPPQAMPDKYKNKDTIKAYQNYYLGEKSALFSWKNRAAPECFRKIVLDF